MSVFFWHSRQYRNTSLTKFFCNFCKVKIVIYYKLVSAVLLFLEGIVYNLLTDKSRKPSHIHCKA